MLPPDVGSGAKQSLDALVLQLLAQEEDKSTVDAMTLAERVGRVFFREDRPDTGHVNAVLGDALLVYERVLLGLRQCDDGVGLRVNLVVFAIDVTLPPRVVIRREHERQIVLSRVVEAGAGQELAT